MQFDVNGKPQAARWSWQWKVTGDCDGVTGCTSRTCDGEERFACFEIPLPREMRDLTTNMMKSDVSAQFEPLSAMSKQH
ncbi:hypothetical protein G5I_14251 [Acromyrmex echinatior]|uniref:Uncharacterized protein n=1 Tax=Acromyrmex echinatior TaxID=103372 RepID=F4X7B1_ACREC|nr:hypothetical protein G5I_14251 [Acromyrmex echinatior]